MNTMPTVPSNNDVAPQRSRSFRWDLGLRALRNSLILILLIILLIVGCESIAMLASLFLPSMQAAREAARRAQCAYHLKEIGLALQSYHQKHGSFPPAFIPDENGKPKHSWRVLLLPFLCRQDLYARYRFDEPWDSPNNMALSRQMPSVYRCPSDPAQSRSQANYAMIVGPHAISDGPTARRLSEVKDAPANTIMVAEAGEANINWLEPRDLIVEKMDFSTTALEKDSWRETCQLFRNHDTVANVLFCDGSVRALARESVSPKELRSLMTIDGGEPIPAGH